MYKAWTMPPIELFFRTMRIRRYFRFIVWVILIGWCQAARAREPLTSIAAIRKLPPEKADKALAVRVEGQILWIHPTAAGFFLHGEGKGIYVRRPPGMQDMGRFSIGEIVWVKGETIAGNFSPAILAESVESVGMEPLPEARPFYAHEIYFGTIDCDWVWLAGRIVSMHVSRGGPSADNITLGLEHHNSILDVQIPLTEGAEQKVEELMFQRVRFNAVAGTKFNTKRQVIGRIFFVNSVNDLEIVDDYKPRKGVKLEAIHELLRSGDNHRHEAYTHGLVSHVAGQHIYLRGDEACLKVNVRGEPDVKVGDYVELKGFILPRPVSPAFAAREIRVTEHRSPPEPVTLQINEALREHWDFNPDSSLNDELVQVEAQLVDVGESFGLSTGQKELILLCRHDAHLFEAKLPVYPGLPEEVKPGAALRLTGICNLTHSEERRWRLYVDWFWIQLRSADDIEILMPAPWWTIGRLLWLLGIVLGIAILFLIWVGALRKVVARQTGIITKQVERETIHDERQRIARELHDNLEQGLAGMAIQLRGSLRLLDLNMKKRLESIHRSLQLAHSDNEPLKDHLELAASEVEADALKNKRAIDVVQGMLAHCSEESRTSILDLRGGLLERMDLPAALRESLQPLADECGADLKIKITGHPRRLKKIVERNLLLIAKEAVTNAARHAEPDAIHVELTYAPEDLALSIIDDGCGFEVDSVSQAGRFGLQGMHERVNRLHGSIQVRSAPGEGTSVGVNIPLNRERELEP